MMKILSMALLSLLLAASVALAGTSLSGSLAGAWTFNSDNTASSLAAGLGATYRPDKIEALQPTKLGKFTVEPSNFVFWTQQWFRDGAADMNATGAGYSLFKVPNFELIAEGGAVFKGLDQSAFKVGAVGLADVRFVTLGKGMAFKIGAGYDGDKPLMILSLGFETD